MNAIASVHPSQAVALQQPDPLITIEKLQVRFGEVAAIDGLSLIVRRGEFISLLGPSGCGKSTLLRAIARLVPAAGGDIIMRDAKLRVGFMFQKPMLLPWRTALGNVVLPVEIQNGGSVVDATDDYRARRMLDMVQLGDFVDAYPQQLSGGMQQRVALARALMGDPDVLLLDEPFGALDELTREVLNEELVRIWQSRETRLKTVIMVTHSIPEAVIMSDRVIVLTARPARLIEDVAIHGPRPRTPEDPDSISIMKHIRMMVRASR